ncbi:hypothetical protein Q9314_01715 [Shinella sumterensis]|nr:hypothetical protein Q9314_01715 [Shinella sumterensis]
MAKIMAECGRAGRRTQEAARHPKPFTYFTWVKYRQQKRPGRNRTDLPHHRLFRQCQYIRGQKHQAMAALRAAEAFQRSSAMPMTEI